MYHQLCADAKSLAEFLELQFAVKGQDFTQTDGVVYENECE
jgi:hypothetical protein